MQTRHFFLALGEFLAILRLPNRRIIKLIKRESNMKTVAFRFNAVLAASFAATMCFSAVRAQAQDNAQEQ